MKSQYYENSTRYNELMREEKENLFLGTVGNHPLVRPLYYPETLLLFRDEFVDKPAPTTSPIFGAPVDYLVNMIFDPCRNYGPDCCDNRFGTPEYLKNENTSSQIVLNEDGTQTDPLISRVSDQLLLLDEVCTGLETPLTVIDTCVGCM